MPFRARMKRAFTRTPSSSSNSSSSLGKVESRGLGDPKVYQPGETMPRPKYRAPVDKKHKAALDSYTFGGSSRRKSVNSGNSLYSPMGSRLPSRNNSIQKPGWSMRNHHTHIEKLAETTDDGTDVANVGGASRRPSKDGRVSHLHTRGNSIAKPQHIEDIDMSVSASAPDHTPFTVAELNTALDRSTSKVPMETL